MSFSNSLSSEISRNEYIGILFFCVKVSNSEINLSIRLTVISIQFDHGTQKFILIITTVPYSSVYIRLTNPFKSKAIPLAAAPRFISFSPFVAFTIITFKRKDTQWAGRSNYAIWEILEKCNKFGNQSKWGGGFRSMMESWQKYASNGWWLDIRYIQS